MKGNMEINIEMCLMKQTITRPTRRFIVQRGSNHYHHCTREKWSPQYLCTTSTAGEPLVGFHGDSE